jgi:hypothetical protein
MSEKTQLPPMFFSVPARKVSFDDRLESWVVEAGGGEVADVVTFEVQEGLVAMRLDRQEGTSEKRWWVNEPEPCQNDLIWSEPA